MLLVLLPKREQGPLHLPQSGSDFESEVPTATCYYEEEILLFTAL